MPVRYFMDRIWYKLWLGCESGRDLEWSWDAKDRVADNIHIQYWNPSDLEEFHVAQVGHYIESVEVKWNRWNEMCVTISHMLRVNWVFLSFYISLYTSANTKASSFCRECIV